ncbi:hypothetical protein OAK91_00630 [Planctomycetaceae bacterium]|nr:hypothetical protein [Planctomycetaceae bacterium]MDC0273219.1 hypothetical protein [Planctomycetaceae bacterium]
MLDQTLLVGGSHIKGNYRREEIPGMPTGHWHRSVRLKINEFSRRILTKISGIMRMGSGTKVISPDLQTYPLAGVF